MFKIRKHFPRYLFSDFKNKYLILEPNYNFTLKNNTMAYFIKPDVCTSCGACKDECPVEAISEGADFYIIDADKCTDCGACADVCPVEAIIAQ